MSPKSLLGLNLPNGHDQEYQSIQVSVSSNTFIVRSVIHTTFLLVGHPRTLGDHDVGAYGTYVGDDGRRGPRAYLHSKKIVVVTRRGRRNRRRIPWKKKTELQIAGISGSAPNKCIPLGKMTKTLDSLQETCEANIPLNLHSVYSRACR